MQGREDPIATSPTEHRRIKGMLRSKTLVKVLRGSFCVIDNQIEVMNNPPP